jgi:2-dehydropantoate 2-reductase
LRRARFPAAASCLGARFAPLATFFAVRLVFFAVLPTLVRAARRRFSTLVVASFATTRAVFTARRSVLRARRVARAALSSSDVFFVAGLRRAVFFFLAIVLTAPSRRSLGSLGRARRLSNTPRESGANADDFGEQRANSAVRSATNRMKVGVLGAGAIGGYLGVRLSAAGVPVTLVGRPDLVAAHASTPLVAFALDGTAHPAGADLVVTTDPAALGGVDVCLVAVKSRDSESAAQSVASVLRPETVVVSFQNGLRNPERLRAHLPAQRVVAGMVSYNVLREGVAVFRQATKGPLVAARGDGESGRRMRELVEAFARAGERLDLHARVEDVIAGKLLLNLNNGVCAVTGSTIAESLRSRTLRWCFARLMREGLAVMRAAGLRPTSVIGIPPGVIARVLGLPDAIVLRVARSLVAIDPRAKSSTLQDLEAGKPTEIDDLSGEIVRLARARDAPANRIVVDAVHALETSSRPLSFWTPETLRERLSEV